jgi:hypothetical protein
MKIGMTSLPSVATSNMKPARWRLRVKSDWEMVLLTFLPVAMWGLVAYALYEVLIKGTPL